MIKEVIYDVSPINVVQIVINNGFTFMKAKKMLMKKFDFYWTPCATHRIHLMFEDVSKWKKVVHEVSIAKKIINFIYNYSWLLAQIRKFSSEDIVCL